MRERNIVSLIIIAALGLVSAFLAAPVEKPAFVRSLVFWQDERVRDLQLKQGLDLRGGLQVLLVADLPAGQSLVTGTLASAVSIIEGRVNALGTSEPTVQQAGNDRILVELPGVTNREAAIDLVKKQGVLEFVEATVANRPQEGLPISTTFSLFRSLMYPETSSAGRPIDANQTVSGTRVYRTAFTGEILLNNSRVGVNAGQSVVVFSVKPSAQTGFGDFTGKNIGQPLCIVLDGIVLQCPSIRAALPTGGEISGGFTPEGANSLAVTLNYGSLPVPLKIESVKDVGATLGADSVRRSVFAGLIGLSVLVIFMIAYYRVPGAVVSLSIIFFSLFTLAVYVLLPVVLTLPGIAGFVLSIATAVDANILVLERFKEELRGGRSLRGAVEAAFARAWTSIRDSNISTLITCAILFMFGNTFGASAVKGFALTLALGILISMFTAMVVTRALMRGFFSREIEDEAQRASLLGA
ncbi:MAG: protein translocase subunit SecD [Thermoflexales bacterium]|jgi:preprotein translocase subunit SecD|nr:protein translocase subunit SecD [Thermoflexales bacterium]MBP8242469.1 protein translocase subunit SecD [Thermoflexales bacterium]